jgi:hypothetical protein
MVYIDEIKSLTIVTADGQPPGELTGSCKIFRAAGKYYRLG